MEQSVVDSFYSAQTRLCHEEDAKRKRLQNKIRSAGEPVPEMLKNQLVTLNVCDKLATVFPRRHA